MEGSLIDGDDPSSRYAVQQDFKSDRPFDRDFSSFDEAKMGAPANSSLGYQDRIMGMVGNDPFAGMNALEKDIAKQAMNTSQAEFDSLAEDDFEEMRGIDSKDAPVSFMNRMNNPNVFDPIVNTKNFVQELPGKINSGITGVMDFMGRLPTPFNACLKLLQI